MTLSMATAGDRVAVPVQTDLNVVTAIDVSGSVDAGAERLELLGMASALTHPDVLQAIAAGHHGRIGFSAFTWSSAGGAFVQLAPWTVIGSRSDAERVARALRAAHNLRPEFYRQPWANPEPRPWVPGLSTDISAALEHAMSLLGSAPFTAARQVVNICANGEDNVGIGPDRARERAAARDIVVNGVVLSGKAGLVDYFREHVQTGSGSFVIEVAEFGTVTHALLRKFVAEIAWLRPPR
jgi:hypothetical protein